MQDEISDGSSRSSRSRVTFATAPAITPMSSLVTLDVNVRGSDFVDGTGRVLSLRGVNLGGTSKLPMGDEGMTHVLEGFFDSMRSVSFVGRPFPLNEANDHFTRMRAWGFTCIRLIVTWEAIEHAGPGQYDREYIAYIAQLVQRARHFGLAVYIDPHQDVWSRFSGGSGAPGWTFEMVGLNVRAFGPTGAALVHQTWGGEGADKTKFPRMCWPTNLHKLACATMFTLFWAGDVFAPQLRVEGESAQAFLQGHYIRAIAQVAGALRNQPNVLGIGTMNEPLPGYIGIQRLDRLSGPLRNDLMPTPFEGMALGAGFALKVGRYTLDSLKCLAAGMPLASELMNGERLSAWLPGHSCIWRAHGVWDVDARTGEPVLLQPEYFGKHDFAVDFYVPFAKAFSASVRTVGHANWQLFIELPPADLGLCTFPMMDGKEMGGPIVHAPHWYDQLTLFLGKFVRWMSIDVQRGSPAFGSSSVGKMRSKQLAHLQEQASTHVGGVPTLIGEVGIPFDMHDREVYLEHKRFSLANCEAALSATVDALESCNLNYTLWCYSADHTAEWGDGWNREDLSIFSRNVTPEVPPGLDPFSVHLGGRALRAFVRPYAMALAGSAVKTPKFDTASRVYHLVFRHNPEVRELSLIFVPTSVQYAEGFAVSISDGEFTIEALPSELGGHSVVRYAHDWRQAVHSLTISPSNARQRRSSISSQLIAADKAVRQLSLRSPLAQARARPGWHPSPSDIYDTQLLPTVEDCEEDCEDCDSDSEAEADEVELQEPSEQPSGSAHLQLEQPTTPDTKLATRRTA